MATSSPSSDWQTGKTLSECFDHIFTSGLASDVTFLVGEAKERITAHRLVLLSRSPVFYAMLEGPMAEKGEIIIPDISEEIFKLFLRYLYTDQIDLTSENVVPVLNAARKYCVGLLVSDCEKFLSSNLSSDNVCLLLEHAHVFVMDNLKSDCLRIIFDNPTAALQSESFTELCLSCVTSITESDDLRVTENIVYDAIVRWAEAECSRQNLEVTVENSRKVLGDTLYTVRYLHLDEEFLFGKVCSDLILKSEDVVDLINHKRSNRPLVSEYLNTKKRVQVPVRVHRNGPMLNAMWISPPVDDGISFKASADIYLHGFGSFHTNSEPSSVDLQVLEGLNCLVATTKPLAASLPDTPYMGDVVLDEPIKLHAGREYTIIELSNKHKMYYFENGKPKVTHEKVTVEFINSRKSTTTNTNRGQIPYLLLSF